MQERKLTIYFTSDLHSYIYPTDYRSQKEQDLGLFKCASQFQKDGNTLIIDGGDLLQGSPFGAFCHDTVGSAAQFAQIMNRCGYDYVTLGNHDFNYGMPYLDSYLNALRARCVCENVRWDEGDVRFPARVHMLENGLRVGIIGIVTDYVNIWERPEHLSGIRIEDPIPAAAAALAAMLLVKSGWVKMAAPYVFAVSLLYALTGLLLRVYWTQYVLALTILHVAVYCLYVIYMLYRTEFFLCSLVTVAAGVLFYRYSHGIGANLACIALALLLVVLIGATAWIAANAAKGHGRLRVGKKKLAFFPSSFNPLALYITCAVWLVCFLACLLIGAAFAYYCTFAAVAFELIAAVYYTFQLK